MQSAAELLRTRIQNRDLSGRHGASRDGHLARLLRQPAPAPEVHESPHLGTRQYARILNSWIEEIGLDPTAYDTHTIRRTKASLIYRRTKNIRAVQLLLGHTNLESTVRYLGIKAEDALELLKQTEI